MISLSISRIAGLGRVAALVALSPFPAVAHHSFASFDMTKTMTLEGTVKTVQLTVPHSRLIFLVPDRKGEPVEWILEAGGPSTLIKAGLKKTDLKVGDKVTFAINPSRNGEPQGNLLSMTFADGRTVRGGPFGGPGAPPADGPGDAQ